MEMSQQGGAEVVLQLAGEVRRARFGNQVRLCSIVPGKLGACPNDCKWCAQSGVSAPNLTESKRTPVSEMLQAAEDAAELGSASIGIVNSGKTPAKRDIDDVIQASGDIYSKMESKIGICASLGELSQQQAEMLTAAKITRYHHNLETSRSFFSTVVSSHTYESKLKTLQVAKDAGFKICSGGLFGMGETWADRIELAETLRDVVKPDIVPLNFLSPIPETPLGELETLPKMEILTIIAIYRLMLPDLDIKVAGGREKTLGSMQNRIFAAGATSCMIGNYLTTAGQRPADDLKMLQELGLKIVNNLINLAQKP
ncbi:MAG: biotin synthase BioB [Phycisphaerae bacterium]|nr:biotin synthase BioB [Phycisphaerae bacterium]